MATYSKAFTTLFQQENEPIRWLLGEVLAEYAARKQSHFMLDLLERPNYLVLAHWNYWVSEFRSSVVNPELAVHKAKLELKSATSKDAQEKLRSFMAEIFAVLRLRKEGYERFEVVVPETKDKSPDFLAEFQGKRVRVEVKNLQEPEDRIQSVVMKRWEKNRDKEPDRYGFRVAVQHSHRGSLTRRAISRLHEITDELPNIARDTIEEELDGGVKVRFEKFKDRPTVEPPPDVFMSTAFEGRHGGTLMVQSTVKETHFDFDQLLFQAFFLKALRVVADSTTKFFAEAKVEDAINVLFLNWEPPDIFVNLAEVEYVRSTLEELFDNVKLNLKLFIAYQQPEVPLQILRDARDRQRSDR